MTEVLLLIMTTGENEILSASEEDYDVAEMMAALSFWHDPRRPKHEALQANGCHLTYIWSCNL